MKYIIKDMGNNGKTFKRFAVSSVNKVNWFEADFDTREAAEQFIVSKKLKLENEMKSIQEMTKVAHSIIADYGTEYARIEHVNWLISTGVHPILAEAIVKVAIEESE